MKKYSNKEIEEFRRRARRLIPSGAHTYSRADEVFSGNAPAFIQKGKGALCYDLSGEEFVDYGMGVFSVSLGHAFPEVIEAVARCLRDGNSFTRPSLLEGELAEELCSLIPSAQMVKFSKNGSDVTSAAVRLARAYTGRDNVITIKEQPFHSFDDWFIGSTSRPSGIPNHVREQTWKVPYNDFDALEQLVDLHPDEVACILMEPVTFDPPHNGYLERIRELCDRRGVLLIFDEIITGFRWQLQGAQAFFGVTPDLSTFGKGMANGFPLAALTGREDIMRLGDFSGDLFLLSCTYGGELLGLTAARETIRQFQTEPWIEQIWNYGERLIKALREQVEAHQLGEHVQVVGYPCRPDILFFEKPGEFSFALKTLFVQEMIKGRVLMERICISASHTPEILQRTLDASSKTFSVMRQAIDSGDVMRFIEGDLILPVFT